MVNGNAWSGNFIPDGFWSCRTMWLDIIAHIWILHSFALPHQLRWRSLSTGYVYKVCMGLELITRPADIDSIQLRINYLHISFVPNT